MELECHAGFGLRRCCCLETIKQNNQILALSDKKIAEIAHRILSDDPASISLRAPNLTTNTMPMPAPTMDKAELGQVSEQALQTYLKGFNLLDRENGLAPGDLRAMRDASSGANLRGDELSNSGRIAPLAQGARLVLKAVESNQTTTQ